MYLKQSLTVKAIYLQKLLTKLKTSLINSTTL